MARLLRSFGGDLMRREFGTLEYEIGLHCGAERGVRVPVRRARFRENAPGPVEVS
jgi:hypothetical protein